MSLEMGGVLGSERKERYLVTRSGGESTVLGVRSSVLGALL